MGVISSVGTMAVRCGAAPATGGHPWSDQPLSRIVRPATIAIATAVLACAVAGPASARERCGEPRDSRGEWPSYGRDLANTRHQPLERGIGPRDVRSLRPAWVFDTGVDTGLHVGSLSDFNGTPIVAGGCVFVGSAHGLIVALDADDGAVVWRHTEALGARERPGLAGVVAASVAVTDEHVVALVNREADGSGVGPYAIGLDRHSGEVRWRSATVQADRGGYTNANPVVFDDLLVYGYSAEEGRPGAQGGFAVIDARDGRVLANTATIPPSDQAEGFSGGGVWTAPAVDARRRLAYLGTANPYSKRTEHRRNNAILKVDLRRDSPTLGAVLDVYKGEVDQGERVLERGTRPSCELAGDDRTAYETLRALRPEQLRDFDGTIANSQQCGQLNLAFGAGVNLFSIRGVPVVGGLHKSGYYHAVRRRDMRAVWRKRVGIPPCEVCNASSPAFDGRHVYAAVTTPVTAIRSVDAVTGRIGWTGAIGDGGHYQPVSVANDVVYTVDNLGFLDAFDADTGVPVARLPLFVDAGRDAPGFHAAGVAIARGRIYVSVGSQVVAYGR